jgi:hypothetical protein
MTWPRLPMYGPLGAFNRTRNLGLLAHHSRWQDLYPFGYHRMLWDLYLVEGLVQ